MRRRCSHDPNLDGVITLRRDGVQRLLKRFSVGASNQNGDKRQIQGVGSGGKVRIILCPFETAPQLIIAFSLAILSRSLYQLAMEL